MLDHHLNNGPEDRDGGEHKERSDPERDGQPRIDRDRKKISGNGTEQGSEWNFSQPEPEPYPRDHAELSTRRERIGGKSVDLGIRARWRLAGFGRLSLGAHLGCCP